jgi:maltose alpha-D-glucosyltransferase/alpha-amylase
MTSAPRASASASTRILEEQVTAEDPQATWYKDAIVYELHVKAFFDSNGDGIGDFAGLIQRLDYIARLGVTAIWLLPFYPSPLRDDGYDTADYRTVHPSYGTLRDARRLVREAHARGLRVITELVCNHTSDQHPWFQRARRARPGTVARDFYVWSDNEDRYPEARIIFKDFEPSNWTWDPIARAFYLHRFYAHQPDLNFDNPSVQVEILKVVDFWFDAGVDGLRLDAVPYLFEREGTNCENLPETHRYLRSLRQHIDERYENRMLLAEASAAARATNATWRSTSRSCRACSWGCAWRTGSRSSTSSSRRRPSLPPASGRSSCATTTS